MMRVISSFGDGPVNFNPTGPAEDQTQKLMLSTELLHPINTFLQNQMLLYK